MQRQRPPEGVVHPRLAKIEALSSYESQFKGKSQAGEVFPGGERPLFDQIRSQCASYGILIRAAYGEPFWSRETKVAESLGTLEVGTF